MKYFLTVIALLLAFNAQTEPTLEQIVVIGSRSPEPLQSLPQSIGVVDHDALNTISAVHPSEALFRIPGVWISRGNGQESLTAIRSPVFTGAGACGEFLYAENNVPLRASGFCNVNELFDAHSELAERIEVQRGPGSVVFGANALHGMVNIVTPPPPMQTPLLQGQLESGPHDYERISLQAGHHDFLVQFTGSHDGGFKEDSGYDQQKLTLIHHADHDNLSIDSWLTATNLNQETAGFVEYPDAYKYRSLKKVNPDPDAYRDASALRIASRLQWTMDENTSLIVTPYGRHNRMQFLQHFVPWLPTEKNGHDSLGVQTALQHQYGNLTWLAGIDLEYSSGFLKEYQDQPFSPSIPAGYHYDYDVDITTFARYLQLQWAIDPIWTATFGARNEFIRYDYDNHLGGGSACAAAVINCRFYRPADSTDDFNTVSPSMGIVGQLTDTLHVFAQAAQGYRPPQTAELYRLQGQQAFTDIDPTTLNSLEFGWSQELINAQYTVTLFTMRKDNVIYQDSLRWNVDGAKTRHDGVELSLNWDMTDTLSLGVDASYARHQYDSNESLAGLVTSINGNDIDTAPREIGSARLDWHPNERINTELEWISVGSYYTDPENWHQYEGHDLLNLRVGFKVTPRWQLWVRVHNLTDEDYADRADYAFGNERYFIGEPRSVYFAIEGNLF
ncbi:MAG TPA: TonB-dependent receptor [Pseudomonadales bacterium]